ncbi:hypothetical protein [Prevotella sp. 10(H)]|uniref:hypothetical protein n=1 Tax=Prevotella sp. 10(H) TaxID=1158294 RepID=UPI0009DE72F1|nr:hypothetical protein [Prevotella sp. 10(H)]
MKKFGQTLILLVAAVTVFLTGAGVTIVNYCCTSCSGQTLFMTGQHVCCAESFENEEVMSCCSSHEAVVNETSETVCYDQDSHCTASRLSIDIDASSFRPHVSVPFMWISDASFTPTSYILPEKIEYSDEYIRFESPPDILPREYLSFIRVLII